MSDQQRLRPACAYAQSDQSLCLSLEYSMTVRLLSEQHLEFLPLKGGCTGSFESIFAKMPHCWKSHVSAHMCSLIGPFVVPCPAAQWPVQLNKMPSQIILEWTIIRPPDKSAYQKIIFLISQPKHMLWVLKRTVSMRRFF